MSLAQYLEDGKIELLWREIESSTRIEWKTQLCWLINEPQLEKRLELGSGRGSVIVIILRSSAEVSKLCLKRLRFGGGLKVVENYWEAGPGSGCMSSAGVGHDRLEECGDKAIKSFIWADAHKMENERCGVLGPMIKMSKICIHIMLKCANCGRNNIATTLKCPARIKT